MSTADCSTTPVSTDVVRRGGCGSAIRGVQKGRVWNIVSEILIAVIRTRPATSNDSRRSWADRWRYSVGAAQFPIGSGSVMEAEGKPDLTVMRRHGGKASAPVRTVKHEHSRGQLLSRSKKKEENLKRVQMGIFVAKKGNKKYMHGPRLVAVDPGSRKAGSRRFYTRRPTHVPGPLILFGRPYCSQVPP